MAELRLFHWQAIDASGNWQQGEYLTRDSLQVSAFLAEQDLAPLRIRAGRRFHRREWKDAQRISLMRQLAALLKAGMTLAASLALLSEGQPHAGWRALLMQVKESISLGEPFSSTLLRWPSVFPPLYTSLIQIGELTGQLEHCCQRLAEQQERQLQLEKKVRKALRYPLFILLVAAGVSSGMLLFVLPEFVAIYATFDAPLPLFTALVMQLADALHVLAPWLFVVVTTSLAGWRYQRRRSVPWRCWEQRLLLRMPLIAVLSRGNRLSQIFTTLSLTQRAGLTLLESLQAVEKTVPEGIWQQAMSAMQEQIAAGRPLYQSLPTPALFTPLCRQLIRVGEESGALDEMLERLAQWHETQTHEKADTLAALLEPMMMLVIGGIIGVLVVAMYLPVFNLGDALG